jgi:hypothetical protein
MPSLQISDGTNWKTATSIQISDGTTWQPIKFGYISDGTSWQQFYSSSISSSSPSTISQSTNGTTYLITLTGTYYSWTGAGPRSLTYKFQKSTDNSTWSDLTTYATLVEPASGNSGTKTYTLAQADVVANTTNYYRFTVHATVGAITGDSTSTSTSVEAPRNITDLAATAVSGSTSSIDLSWTAPTGAGRIQVQYKRAIDSTWTTFGGVTGASTSVRVTGLTTNTSYNFKLTPWTGSTGSTSGTYTGYYGNDSNTVTKSTNNVYLQGTGQVRRVTLPSAFTTASTTMYISTNGFIGVGSDPASAISIPTSGLYVSPLQGDMQQTALWTISNATGFYVRWQGNKLSTPSESLDYQAIFYWGSTAVDVNFVTNNLTTITASDTAVENNGSITQTWSSSSTAASSTLLSTSGMTRNTTQDGVDDNRTAITASKPSSFVNPGTPTSPVNSFTSGTSYDYTCSWTAPTTGTTPMSYYLQVYGGSSKTTATNYVGTFGPSGALSTYTGTDGGGFTGTTGSYHSTYAWNNFQVYAVNYDGTNYHSGSNSTSSTTE